MTLKMWIFTHLGEKYCKNVKLAKMTLFRQVRGHENLQFFWLSWKPFKMMKNNTTWPQDSWNVNLYPFGWEMCKNVKLTKMTLFRQVRSRENLQFFRLAWKAFKMMISTTTWPLDTWNVNIYPFGWEICKKWEISKNDFFNRSAVMKIFTVFDFLESLLKWWKTPPHDHWTLETWIFTHLVEKCAKNGK